MYTCVNKILRSMSSRYKQNRKPAGTAYRCPITNTKPT